MEFLTKEYKPFNLKATGITKTFSFTRPIFKEVSLELNPGEVIGITGNNGSGKTTLLRILASVLKPSKGDITLEIDGKNIPGEKITEHLGFIGPYLNLYEEFTPLEHIDIFMKLKNVKVNHGLAENLLEVFNLYQRRHSLIRTFSSGMKQRMKFILALLNEPEILFLDEPFTNLDAKGIDVVEKVIDIHRAKNGGMIIASNDEREKSHCIRFLNLE